jgi:hypothetical protein
MLQNRTTRGASSLYILFDEHLGTSNAEAARSFELQVARKIDMNPRRGPQKAGKQIQLKPSRRAELPVPDEQSVIQRDHMSPTLSIPDLAKLNLSPQARVKLSVLTFFFQQPVESVLDRAMGALIDALPPEEKHLVLGLNSRFVPHGIATVANGSSRLADQIRAFVVAEYLRPAREKHEKHVSVRVKDVHKRLGLVQRYPAIVSALQAKSFLEHHRLRPVDSDGTKDGSTRVLVFELL